MNYIKEEWQDREGRSKIIMLGILLISVLSPFVFSSYTIFVLSRVLLMAVVAMAYVFLAGFGGMASFAHIAFYGIAGYVTAIGVRMHGMPFWPMAIRGVLSALVASLVFAIVSVRATGRYFFQISIALVQLVYLTSVQWADLTGGLRGIPGIKTPTIFGLNMSNRNVVFYFMLIFAILAYLSIKRISESPFGIALKGTRDNPQKMSAMGFNVSLIRTKAIIVAAFFSSVCGVISIILYRVIAPENIGTPAAIIIMFMGMIGCVKKIEGAFLGSLIFVFLQDTIGTISDRYNTIVGIFFLIIVIFFPQGFLGTDYKKVWQDIKKNFSGNKNKKIKKAY